MTDTKSRISMLSELNVIPDVLSDGLKLAYDLRLEWPEAKLDKPGEELGREDTQAEPKVFIHPPVRLLHPSNSCQGPY